MSLALMDFSAAAGVDSSPPEISAADFSGGDELTGAGSAFSSGFVTSSFASYATWDTQRRKFCIDDFSVKADMSICILQPSHNQLQPSMLPILPAHD